MPYGYAIDPARRLVMVTVTGPWDFESALAAMRAVRADPGLRPHDRILVDLRAAEFAPTAAEVRAFAALQATPAGYLRHRVAVVARPPLAAAMAQEARLCRARGAACRAFRSPGRALAWLEAPTPARGRPAWPPPPGAC